MKIPKKLAIFLSLILTFVVGVANFATATPSKSQEKTQPAAKAKYDIYKIKGSKFLSNIDKRLKPAKKTDSFPVIITFQSQDQSGNLQKVKNKIPGFAPKHVYKHLPSVSAKLTKEQIEQLADLPQVVQIEYDEPVKGFSDSANYWYGTQKARTDFGVTGDRDGKPNTYSKTDATIAIMDTGIDPNHVDLKGKIIGWKDFVNNRSTPYDDHGHGTHVAGIAAGAGKGNSAYTGVAPGASLVGIKVLDSTFTGSTSTLAAAIDWAIANKNTYGIDIINISMGTFGSSDGTDAASQAVNRAHQAGILVVVAAGENGPTRQTIGSPGAATHAFTVGAMADPSEGGFFLLTRSGRGPTKDGRIKPDIVAPGYYITAPKANSTNGYIVSGGTSAAAPFVAGTAALIHDAKPSLTPDQIKSIMTSTAIDFAPYQKDIDFGSGNLRAYDAIKSAGYYFGTGPSWPYLYPASNSINTSRYKDEWILRIDTKDYPIAITMIMPNPSSSQNFDIFLYDPDGKLVADSTWRYDRQETISYRPTKTGRYKIRVQSTSGTGPYTLNVSASSGSLYIIADDQP